VADRPDSAEVLDLLVIATDVLTRKNLRRDMGLGREATIARIRRPGRGRRRDLTTQARRPGGRYRV
jgi:hypothetical protein